MIETWIAVVICVLCLVLGIAGSAVMLANRIDDAYWEGFHAAMFFVENGDYDEARRQDKAFGRG